METIQDIVGRNYNREGFQDDFERFLFVIKVDKTIKALLKAFESKIHP